MMEKNTPGHEQKNQTSKDGGGEERIEPRSSMGRRDFLQVGLLGVAAASCTGVGPVVGGDGGDGEPGRGGGGGGTALESDVPAIKAGDPETWNEPWVWRPSDWPGQQLDLNVVENQNPGIAVGLGNPGSVLFSYGGNTPGPTIRMKGDETLFVKLRNLLGQDFGQTFVGPFPHDAPSQSILDAAAAKARALGNYREDFCLGEHTNGVHSIRVTNLHTHGLHVSPSRNPDGTHSDNVILRVLSQADFRRREQIGAEESCRFLRNPEELYFVRDDEVAGEANYEFRLGNVQRRLIEEENKRRHEQGLPPLPPQPHPAGTFWYHPHAHGATHNQVASGMAGFLLVEGDIEEAINRVLVDWNDTEPPPDPSLKTGPYDYRERLMLMQRALNLSVDKDASKASPELSNPNPFNVLVNGGSTPTVIQMRPGAIERWRVLNGSVDGRGYKRFMVVKGQYTVQNVDGNLKTFEVNEDGQLTNLAGKPDEPFTLAELKTLEYRKQDLFQLSIDGVTLVKQETGQPPTYFINDLSMQGIKPNTSGDSPEDMVDNPLWSYDQRCEAGLRRQLRSRIPRVREGADLMCRLTNVWRTKESVKDCFVRWNEFYMGPANRTDVFFQAPPLSSSSRTVNNDDGTTTTYDVYTVFARTVVVHSDTPQFVAQAKVKNEPPPAPSPEDVIIAYVLVQQTAGEEPIEAANMRDLMMTLEDALPPVQQYLHPIQPDELQAKAEEAEARSDVQTGDFRTRRILYSGWGHPSMPLASTYPLTLDSRGSTEYPTAQAFVDFINSDPMVTFTVDGQTKTERKHENLIYAENPPGAGFYVAMPPEIRTMAIGFNNARIEEERQKAPHPDTRPFQYPRLPRKFDPTDPYRARMLENTAEEWTLYNLTNTLWGNTTTAKKTVNDPVDANNDPFSPDFKQPPTQYGSHYVAFPISRQEGQQQFLKDQNFELVSRGIDHPFHVHQNPFWVMSIEIPDETGALVNILDRPRWMDSIWIPRNRGRIVLRMRFPDYVGAYVHHCHILLHEDNGMMHVIEATPFEDQSNYQPEKQLNIAPRPTPQESYTISYAFFDPDEATGQLYPGFEVTPPVPPTP